jgi:hypothetical protein
VHGRRKPLPFLLHEPRRSVFPFLSRPVPVTAWSTGLRSHKSHHRRTEPEDSTRDLRPLQAQGAEALMVEGQVGQPPSAVLDQGLKAYPLRDLPELPSGRRTATQGHPTILGQYQSSQAAEAVVLTMMFQGANHSHSSTYRD